MNACITDTEQEMLLLVENNMCIHTHRESKYDYNLQRYTEKTLSSVFTMGKAIPSISKKEIRFADNLAKIQMLRQEYMGLSRFVVLGWHKWHFSNSCIIWFSTDRNFQFCPSFMVS